MIDETVSITPSQVPSTGGRLVYTCACGKQHPMGAWGAAHLGNTEFSTRCTCGRLLVFRREGEEAE